jgi:hypothetical protein
LVLFASSSSGLSELMAAQPSSADARVLVKPVVLVELGQEADLLVAQVFSAQASQ